MTNVERYNFENEAIFPTELSSDDLESFFPINDEYCDINVDLFSENVLETFGSELDDDESFEHFFFSSLTTESTDKVNDQNGEDTCATSNHYSDQVVAHFKLNIDSSSEVGNILLPFSKSPSEPDAVGNDLKKDGSCFTDVVIKEEVKEDGYDFMPNISEQRNSSQDQKYFNKDFISTSMYNGNIADLVKTRKRTCNNGKSVNTTSEKVKTKNRSQHKKEQTNKNSTVKNVTVPALSSKKCVSSGSNSQLCSGSALNVKQEPEEAPILYNSITCDDENDSKSIQFITNKASKEKQDIPVKCEVLLSLPKDKVKKQKRSENANDTIVLMKENKNIDPVSLSNANISKSSLDISDCQQLNQSSTNFKMDLIPPYLNSSGSESETEISNVTYACTNISDNDKTSADVCTSSMENSRKVESPSLFKLRISRCANQFKSYVIPAEPIPVHPPQSRLEDINKHRVTDDVASYKEISPVQNVKVEKPLDANKNKHLLDKRQSKELKNNKKKRKKSDKYKDSPKSNLSNQIECKSNDANRMQTNFDVCDTPFDSAITNTPLVSVKKEVTMTETLNPTVNTTDFNFLKNEIPSSQQFDANKHRDCSEKQSKDDMRKCVFPKARKKLKKNDVFQYDSLFNDKSQCDSSKATVSRNCDSNKAKTAETVPIKKIKKEPVDTYEYSEFEMHQSVDVPLDELSNICTFNDKTLGIFDCKTSEKSSPLSNSGNFDAKQNITLNQEIAINKVVNKSQRNSDAKLTNSNSVLKSSKINFNSGNKPTERNSPVSKLSISPISSPYMLEENLDVSPSTYDLVLPEESEKELDPVPFIKSTDSQSSLTSSQGTIVNSENYFQESEASKVSVCELEKDLLDDIFLNSPQFSNFDENLTNESKTLSPPMDAELESFEAEISNQSTYRKTESVQLQKNCMPAKVREGMSIAHVPKDSLQANSAKCTDLKVVGVPQGKKPTDDANQSANSVFFIATMHNSFHFQVNKKGTEEALSQTTTDNKETTSQDNSSECSSVEPKKLPVPKSNARQYRSRKRSRTSSSSSDSFYDHKTAKRVKKYHISRRKELLESSRKKSSYSRHHKSSSRSSFSESRSSHYSYSSTTYDERSRSPAESFRKSERRRHRSSRSRSRRRKRRSPSRSYSRSRSPKSRRGSSHDRPRSVSSSRRNVAEEQEKQTDERRVVYVGQIPDGFSTSDLKERFGRFGRIEDINIQRRNSKRNSNYGFVTFKHTEDACEAIARGNDPPMKPRFDISFGGRRLFCRQRYSDLDKEKELMENNDYYYVPPKADDFDSLLNAELRRTGLHDKKY